MGKQPPNVSIFFILFAFFAAVKKKRMLFPLLLAKAENRCYNVKVNELLLCADLACAAWEDNDIMKTIKVLLLVIVLLAIALLTPSPALI